MSVTILRRSFFRFSNALWIGPVVPWLIGANRLSKSGPCALFGIIVESTHIGMKDEPQSERRNANEQICGWSSVLNLQLRISKDRLRAVRSKGETVKEYS